MYGKKQSKLNAARLGGSDGRTVECMHWMVFPVCCMFMVTLYTNGAVNAHENLQLNTEIEPAMHKLINERIDGNAQRIFFFKWCMHAHTQWLLLFSNSYNFPIKILNTHLHADLFSRWKWKSHFLFLLRDWILNNELTVMEMHYNRQHFGTISFLRVQIFVRVS